MLNGLNRQPPSANIHTFNSNYYNKKCDSMELCIRTKQEMKEMC